MTTIKHNANLDQVLNDYANASPEFDAKVLKDLIEKHPEHARALQRYAQVQLTLVPATPEDIAKESVSDQEMLPRQSKLLQRMQQLRGTTSPSDESKVAQKLASITGEKAIQAASVALFGSCDHGEDLLLLSVIEASSGVCNVPDWFYKGLGTHVHIDPALLQASNTSNCRQSANQRYSAKEKPTESPPITWEEAIEQCQVMETAPGHDHRHAPFGEDPAVLAAKEIVRFMVAVVRPPHGRRRQFHQWLKPRVRRRDHCHLGTRRSDGDRIEIERRDDAGERQRWPVGEGARSEQTPFFRAGGDEPYVAVEAKRRDLLRHRDDRRDSAGIIDRAVADPVARGGGANAQMIPVRHQQHGLAIGVPPPRNPDHIVAGEAAQSRHVGDEFLLAGERRANSPLPFMPAPASCC